MLFKVTNVANLRVTTHVTPLFSALTWPPISSRSPLKRRDRFHARVILWKTREAWDVMLRGGEPLEKNFPVSSIKFDQRCTTEAQSSTKFVSIGRC